MRSYLPLTAPASGICLVSATHRKLSVFNFIYKKGTIDCVSLFSSSQGIFMYALRSAKEERQQKQLPPLVYRTSGYISFFHKLSESLKTACNRVHYRITEVFQLLAELYTSLSINYQQGFKRLCFYLFFIRGGTHKKSPVISFIVASQNFFVLALSVVSLISFP